MIKRMRLELRGAHLDQRGANMFITVAIMFGLLLVVPIFVDFASLHFSHRVSQTGADTAAHAAAVEYALPDMYYSIEFRGHCGEAPSEVVRRYRDDEVVRPLASADLGRGAAAGYAHRHQSELVEYGQYYPSHSGYYRTVAGEPIHALEIYAKTQRPVPLIYQDLYGGERRAPAGATAEVYLDPDHPADHWEEPCGLDDKRHVFRFYWIVRLIDTKR